MSFKALRSFLDGISRPKVAHIPESTAPDSQARIARLQELRSQEPIDALRFRFWFRDRDGKTLMEWRNEIDARMRDDG